MKFSFVFMLMLIFTMIAQPAFSDPMHWKKEWPRTNFSKHSVDYNEIMSGGPAKDGIPALNKPRFKPVAAIDTLGLNEPVIVLSHEGQTKAYPLRVLIWHEIANDVIGGLPVSVTYCPLCNSAIVFDRRLEGRVLDFGVSGKLRNSDMIMYDRQTESWWQQFIGRGIAGEMNGKTLHKIPSRVMPFGRFKAQYPKALVMVPNKKAFRRYGFNPYVHYDSSEWPIIYRGLYDGPVSVPALAYVVAIENQAWPLANLRVKGEIRAGNLVLRWHKGMNSALDSAKISKGRDIGYVTAQRQSKEGHLQDEVYNTGFAFAFKAFYPDGVIHEE